MKLPTRLWDAACGVHSQHTRRITPVTQSAPVTSRTQGWARMLWAAVKRTPRAVGGLVLSLLMLILVSGPVMAATGSSPAAAAPTSCDFLPGTVGAGPEGPFDGLASILPRQNLTTSAAQFTTQPDGSTQFADLPSMHYETVGDVLAASNNGFGGPPTGFSQRTAYELFGTAVNFTAVGWGSDRHAHCNLINSFLVFTSNMVLQIPRLVSDATIKLKEMATAPSPLHDLYQSNELQGTPAAPNAAGTAMKADNGTRVPNANQRTPGLVEALGWYLFFPLLIGALIILGIWVMVQANKGGETSRRTITSALLWAGLWAIVACTLLVNNNWWKVTGAADAGISTANSSISELLLDATTSSSKSGGVHSPCDLNNNAPNSGTRISSCTIYRTVLFEPWVIGEFGGDLADDAAAAEMTTDSRKAHPFVGTRTDPTFWNWVRCDNHNPNNDPKNFTLVSAPSFWWWTSDDTSAVISPNTCASTQANPKESQPELKACPVLSTLGPEACADYRYTMLAIIGVTPPDYYAIGYPTNDSGNNNLITGSNTHPSKPGDNQGPLAKAKPASPATLLKASPYSERMLIAYAAWVPQGTPMDAAIRGYNGINKIGMALLAAVSSIGLALLLGSLAVMTLMWHVTTLMLILLLPIVAAAAVIPPLAKIGRWWAREFIGSFVIRFLYGLVTTIILVLFQIIAATGGSTGTKLLLLLLVLGASWALIKQVRSGVLTPTIGGQAPSMGGALLAGAAAGGVAGVAATRKTIKVGAGGIRHARSAVVGSSDSRLRKQRVGGVAGVVGRVTRHGWSRSPTEWQQREQEKQQKIERREDRQAAGKAPTRTRAAGRSLRSATAAGRRAVTHKDRRKPNQVFGGLGGLPERDGIRGTMADRRERRIEAQEVLAGAYAENKERRDGTYQPTASEAAFTNYQKQRAVSQARSVDGSNGKPEDRGTTGPTPPPISDAMWHAAVSEDHRRTKTANQRGKEPQVPSVDPAAAARAQTSTGSGRGRRAAASIPDRTMVRSTVQMHTARQRARRAPTESQRTPPPRVTPQPATTGGAGGTGGGRAAGGSSSDVNSPNGGGHPRPAQPATSQAAQPATSQAGQPYRRISQSPQMHAARRRAPTGPSPRVSTPPRPVEQRRVAGARRQPPG